MYEYRKAKLEELRKEALEKFPQRTTTDPVRLMLKWRSSMSILSKMSWKQIETLDDIDRETLAPNWDERTYHECSIGRKLKDEECYNESGHYIFAFGYDDSTLKPGWHGSEEEREWLETQRQCKEERREKRRKALEKRWGGLGRSISWATRLFM